MGIGVSNRFKSGGFMNRWKGRLVLVPKVLGW
jgi:hypothetical protein